MPRRRRDIPGARLFPIPAADEQSFSERQRFALDELRRNPAGLTSSELGKIIHDYFVPQHSGRCIWCSQAGLVILKSLKAAGLVAQRKGGLFQAIVGGPQPPDDDGYDPATSNWPDGFGDAA